MAKKTKLTGPEQFEKFYGEFYGKRWGKLKEALLAPKKHSAFRNPFSKEVLGQGEVFNEFLNTATFFDPPQGDEDGRPGYYMMDLASALAPLSLDIQLEDHVLDLCAAPGGKSFVLASLLKATGSLTSNDRSRDRRERLKKVLKSHLSPESFETVKITGHDASSWCLHEQEAYDKILLDAPCSSERHLLENPKHTKDWKPARTKRLAANQWTMLASAFQVLKSNGLLVYSTCSISPLENDGVVEKMKKKFDGQFELKEFSFDLGEKTPYGHIILPDENGWGPFYLSIIKKL